MRRVVGATSVALLASSYARSHERSNGHCERRRQYATAVASVPGRAGLGETPVFGRRRRGLRLISSASTVMSVVAGALLLGTGVSYLFMRTLGGDDENDAPSAVASSPTLRDRREDTAPKKSKRYTVYSFGSNLFGQLGVGDERDRDVPTPVAAHVLEGERVVQVAASSKNTGLVTATGKVFMCGAAADQRLGSREDIYESSLMKIALPSAEPSRPAILQRDALSLGEFGAALVTRRGELITWGRNWSGENGFTVNEPFALPRAVPVPGYVAFAARGRETIVFLDEVGRAFEIGAPILGHPVARKGFHPTARPVQLPSKEVQITKVSCGREYCVALDAQGKLYSWGADDHGRLGLGGASFSFRGHDSPMPIPGPARRIIDVSCGESHFFALDEDGVLYGCGNGAEGRLGLGTTSDVHRLTQLPFPEGVKAWTRVSAGGGHTAAITDKGELYVWGRGRSGQIGRGNVVNESIAAPRRTPVRVTALENKRVLDVACGMDHTVVLVEEDSA